MTIDWTKPILWDGKPARVLATDMAGITSVLLRKENGVIAWCDPQGNDADGYPRVTNAPERVERWANVYGNDRVYVHGAQKVADQYARNEGGCVGRMRLTFENDKLVDVAIVPLEDK